MEDHDELCYNKHYSKNECNCRLIEAVREDERNKITAERTARFGVWHDYDPLEGGH